MESQLNADDASLVRLGDVELFSSQDLALCSSEEARALLAYESAVALGVLPISLQQGRFGTQLHCAAVKDGCEVVAALRFIAKAEPIITVVPKELLEEAVVRAYRGSDRQLFTAMRSLIPINGGRSERIAPKIPQPQGDIAKFLNDLIAFAVARGASDLHLCPTATGAFIRVRVDGELLIQDQQHYDRGIHEQLVSRIKVLAGLDIACKRLPQDGACSVPVGNSTRSARVSTLPTVHGESVVLRILYARKLPGLAAIGFDPDTLSLIRRAIAKSNGVVLLTGPTGSGKTTTMYSFAIELQNRGRNVVSVEDPVEVAIPGMVQVQVHEQHGLDFPRAIRSVLRHDPDVILIGEMRDRISAKMALSAGITGHLTVSSLHMGSALEALERLQAFELSPRESAQGIAIVINQRLVPRLCERCKIVDEEGRKRFQRAIYVAVGCAYCNDSGYSGRILVSETLDLQSREVKEIYARSDSVQDALAQIPAQSFISWTSSLEYHLKNGEISMEQVQRFIDEEMAID